MLENLLTSMKPPMSLNEPLLVEIEPTYGCNLDCIMCHVPTHTNKKVVALDLKQLEKATRDLNDIHIILGSEYEPTIHPKFEDLLKITIARNWKVDFLSNGTRLHRYDDALLRDTPFHVFNASFDGFTKESFEYTRKNAKYETVRDNVLRVAEIAKQNGAQTAINATMVRSNINETIPMIDFWNSHGFDLIRLIVAQARSTDKAVLQELILPIKDDLYDLFNEIPNHLIAANLKIGVRNGFFESQLFTPPPGIHRHEATIFASNSNYQYVRGVRQEFLKGNWPGMEVACKSPFVYCRIRWDGNVDFCNRRDWIIGNIYEDSLLNIWNGSKANKIRHQIMADTEGCKSCDYFNFCINSKEIDFEDNRSFFAAGIHDALGIVDSEAQFK